MTRTNRLRGETVTEHTEQHGRLRELGAWRRRAEADGATVDVASYNRTIRDLLELHLDDYHGGTRAQVDLSLHLDLTEPNDGGRR